MSKRKKYINSCEISELDEFDLGGYAQKVLIEGKNKQLPVVITLHGGPGSPVPFGVGCRGLFPNLTDKAVMVYWDQLGCGKNNFPLDDSFSIENFVAMTLDLIKEIKAKFPQNKIYLFGVSWGSILALKACLHVPELLNGVFVYGQFLSNNFFSEEVLNAFSAAPDKVKKAVEHIVKTGGDCKYKTLDKNLQTLFKYLSKYTNAYFNKNSKPIKIGAIARGLLTSPDYSFKDFRAVIKNGYRGNQSLWRELLGISLTLLLAEIKVKYLILQGETDIVTSTANVLKAVEGCNNENVTVRVINNSGHMPSAEAMDECFRTLLQYIE